MCNFKQILLPELESASKNLHLCPSKQIQQNTNMKNYKDSLFLCDVT